MNKLFRKIANATSEIVGSSYAFIFSVIIILLWLVTGPIFDFSDTWQLIINTATTVLTFLMVFLIQNTQNRDSAVIQLKLDELIRAVNRARNDLVDLEDQPDEKIEKVREEFEKMSDELKKSETS